MTPENFCYWLQGMFELTEIDVLSKTQIEVIKNHLQLVFTKVTPDIKICSDTNPVVRVINNDTNKTPMDAWNVNDYRIDYNGYELGGPTPYITETLYC